MPPGPYRRNRLTFDHWNGLPPPDGRAVATRTATRRNGKTRPRRAVLAGFARPAGPATRSSDIDRPTTEAGRDVERELTQSTADRNNYYMTRKRTEPKTMTETLRAAIADSGLSFSELERQTGVLRQCLMKFARSEQSLRLDHADRLATFFELRLVGEGG